MYIGDIFFIKNEIQSCLVYYKMSIEYFIKSNDKLNLAEMYCNIAAANYFDKNFPLYDENYKKGLKIYEQVDNMFMEADYSKVKSLLRIAFAHQEINNKDKSIKIYLYIYDLLKKLEI